MTRRDFELIAAALLDTKPLPSREAGEHRRWKEVAETFAMRLARTNPRFDRARFLRACGVEG